MILCSEVLSRMKDYKEVFEKIQKASNLNIEEVKYAARRMVLFDRCSEGLVVTGVDNDGKSVEVRQGKAIGDFGLKGCGRSKAWRRE